LARNQETLVIAIVYRPIAAATQFPGDGGATDQHHSGHFCHLATADRESDPAMRSPNAEREPVSSASEAKRPLPNARSA
jgi:hypothetical protein